MSDRPDISPVELMAEVEALRQEVAELRTVKLAFQAQNELVRSLVSMGRTTAGRLMLRSMLLQTIKVTIKLTEAEEGSIFLLDGKGVVTESILARGATIKEERDLLIGKVLDQGLAGWVFRNREVGLIEDTHSDPRWVTLPDQPYKVGSALCVPILRGKVLLGIITLTNPDRYHFTKAVAELMEMCATQMAIALDNARLYMIEQQKEQHSHPHETPEPEKHTLAEQGIYIISDKGKFIYANSQMAEIFGYQLSELFNLESFLKLVVTTDYKQVADQIQHCFQGVNAVVSSQFKGQRQDRRLLTIETYATRTKFYGKYVLIGVLRVVL